MNTRNWRGGLFVGLVVGVSVASLSVLNAQSSGTAAVAGGTRTGTIDVQRVLNESQQQKDLADELRQIRERLEGENTQRRQRLDAMQAALDAMNPEDPAYGGRQREFLQAQIDYKNWADVNDAALKREVGVWTAQLYKEMLRSTQAVAAQGGFELVFYRDEFVSPSMDPETVQAVIRDRKLIYAATTTDVTQTVLDKMNGDYRAKPRQPMMQMP
ncbi:MAG: OmpH family outer membrane protein [Planctomycetia bacterium]|nr:MAG: OmpH family outer membrane protein [Planctomycetia bacterium]